ncbi:hypothetical protein Esti_004473 [Eimeria stiedai]
MWRLEAWGALVPVGSVVPVAYASKASPVKWDSTELLLSNASPVSGVLPPRILPRRRGPLPGTLLTSVVLVLSCVAVTFFISACVRKLKAGGGPLASGVRARSLAVGGSDGACGDEGHNEIERSIAAARRQLEALTLSQEDAAWLNSDEVSSIMRAKATLEALLKALLEDLQNLQQMEQQTQEAPPGPVKDTFRTFIVKVQTRIEERKKELKNMGYIATQDSLTMIKMACYWAVDRKISVGASAAVVASVRVAKPSYPVPGIPTSREQGMLKRLVLSFAGKMNTCSATIRSGSVSPQVIKSARAYVREGEKMASLLLSMKMETASKTVSTTARCLAADLDSAAAQAGRPSSSSPSVPSSFPWLNLFSQRGPHQAQSERQAHGFPGAQPAVPPQAPPAPSVPGLQPQTPAQPAAPPPPPLQQHPAGPLSPGDQPEQPAGAFPAHPGEGAQRDPGAALTPGVQPQAPGAAGPPPPLPQQAPVGPLPPPPGHSLVAACNHPLQSPRGPASGGWRSTSVRLSPPPSLPASTQRSVLFQTRNRVPSIQGPTDPAPPMRYPGARPRQPAAPHPHAPPALGPPSISPQVPGPSHAPGPSEPRNPHPRSGLGSFSWSLRRGFGSSRRKKRVLGGLTQGLSDWTRRARDMLEWGPRSEADLLTLEKLALDGVHLHKEAQDSLADVPPDDKASGGARQALRGCSSTIDELRLVLCSRWGPQFAESRLNLSRSYGAMTQARASMQPGCAPSPDSEFLHALASLSDAINHSQSLIRRIHPLLTSPSFFEAFSEPSSGLEEAVHAAEKEVQQAGEAAAACWRNLLITGPHVAPPLGSLVSQARRVLELLATSGIRKVKLQSLEEVIKIMEEDLADKRSSFRKRSSGQRRAGAWYKAGEMHHRAFRSRAAHVGFSEGVRWEVAFCRLPQYLFAVLTNHQRSSLC